jgi:transcriptional regulator with GAF, ATPase, and Fis domain
VHEVPRATPLAAPTAVAPVLACPGCGAEVRLELVPVDSSPRQLTDAGPPSNAPEPSLPDFERSVRDYKRALIGRALAENDGVMTRASKALGLKYTTFVAMVHRLEIDTAEPEAEAD